jgi:L-alanine-DL-glutamate epimerase-like enolase superfamily enzyme
MKITRVVATPLNVPVRIQLVGVDRETSLSACVVDVETDAGLVGHGFTAITEEEVVASAIDDVAAPALIGEDPLNTERLWDRLYWLMSPRGQTGYASHAIAAIDIALWDIKGKALRQPVWRLLGAGATMLGLASVSAFARFWQAEIERWSKVAREAKITAD